MCPETFQWLARLDVFLLMPSSQLEQALQRLNDAGLHEKNAGFFGRVKRRSAICRCTHELTTAHDRLEVSSTTCSTHETSNNFEFKLS